MRISDWSSDVCSSDLSQGSLHLMRLLRDRIAGTPLSRRIVAAYLGGWPVSLEADIPALGLPACTKPGEARCVIAWPSYAEPAEPGTVAKVYHISEGRRVGKECVST